MISVIMSTYNEPLSYIILSIKSILEQSYKDIEFIIVVDNPEYSSLIGILNDYSKTDSRIKVLINDKNLGLTSSLNEALEFASGQYIARMDADDISNTERLKKQLLFLENNRLDLVGSNIQNIDENGIESSCISFFPETVKQVEKYALYDSPVPHPTWLAKRKVYDSLGGYREIDACEDYDFLVRAILQGFKIGNVQEPLLNYRINSKGISATRKTKQKLALAILRENYKIGKETTEQEIFEYIDSNRGRKKARELDEYYRKTAKLKGMKDNKIKAFFYKVLIFATCKEGRQILINLLNERVILR